MLERMPSGSGCGAEGDAWPERARLPREQRGQRQGAVFAQGLVASVALYRRNGHTEAVEHLRAARATGWAAERRGESLRPDGRRAGTV